MLSNCKTYELLPGENDRRKSFYHKALVHIYDDGAEELQSYNTIVLTKYTDGTIEKNWDGWSATTARHIWAYAQISSDDWRELPAHKRIDWKRWKNMKKTCSTIKDELSAARAENSVREWIDAQLEHTSIDNGYEILVTYGGPDIRVNTAENKIDCYWGDDEYHTDAGKMNCSAINAALDIDNRDAVATWYGGLVGYGLKIYDIDYDINDYVNCQSVPDGKMHHLKIYEDVARPYIKLDGRRVHLDEIERTNL